MEKQLPFTDPPSRYLPRSFAGSERRLVRVLEATPGVTLENGHRGTLRAGARKARLLVESAGWIAVHLPFDGKLGQREPLRASRDLPGNVRFAAGAKGLTLRAETPLDGIDHLPKSLEEIGLGLRRGLSGRASRSAPADPPGNDEVRAALEGVREDLGLEPDSLLETDGGWELRLRIAGRAVPVRVAPEAGGVRFTSPVVRLEAAVAPRGSRPAPLPGPLAAEALRWNVRVRFARIVATEGSLVVEARLRTARVSGGWAALACRAVADVTSRVRAPLRLLVADARVARAYAAVFPRRP